MIHKKGIYLSMHCAVTVYCMKRLTAHLGILILCISSTIPTLKETFISSHKDLNSAEAYFILSWIYTVLDIFKVRLRIYFFTKSIKR